MRKIFVTLVSLFAFLLFILPASAQKKTMTWTTTSDSAMSLAFKGAHYFMNNEPALAYDKLKSALELDPDFTVALAMMGNITSGATQKYYRARAQKSAANKTEGEKIFVSGFAPDTTGKSFRDAFTKLHDMFPDGGVINYFYVFTMNSPEAQYKAAQDYVKKFPDEPSMYNLLGYMTMQIKKDTAAAKTYFEKYIALYPEGCNPYDSMGEWYLDTGDLDNAEKYYKMALEKYPFFTNSSDALKKIRDKKKENK
jgi:tetratricopeptide (TPR) repeat protein